MGAAREQRLPGHMPRVEHVSDISVFLARIGFFMTKDLVTRIQVCQDSDKPSSDNDKPRLLDKSVRPRDLSHGDPIQTAAIINSRNGG
jgi:hypothetical protein